MKINMAEDIHVYPVLAPADIVATETGTQYVEMAQIGSGQLEFSVMFGAITATDSTGSVTVKVQTSTGGISTDTQTAIAFNYRLSAAVATDTMGALTAATSSGISITAGTDINKLLLIYVDPAVASAEYCRVLLTPVDAPTSTIVGAVARFVPRYAQASHLSSS